MRTTSRHWSRSPRSSNQASTRWHTSFRKRTGENPRIEVHVWVNSHPIWPGSSWPNDPKHILNRYPEIQTEDYDGNRITEVGYGGDWGHPLYHEWFTKVVLDIVRRYDHRRHPLRLHPLHGASGGATIP
jgi:hypothetical protein